MLNWKFILSLFLLAFLLVFTIPFIKIGLDWLASKIPAAKPVAEFANRT